MVVGLSLMVFLGAAQAQQKKIRVAFGDVLSTETLSMMIALERAKEKGVDYQVTHFAKEDLAIQAVINGQADLGVGTPYAVIQKSKAPLRILFQGTRLVFFPVADKQYKTWKDLNGQPFTFHARGTGTEAIGNIIAKREGIQFGERSYVPGSENRIIAHDERPDQGHHRRPRQQEPADGKGRRPLPRPAGRVEPGVRRDPVRQRRLDQDEREAGRHHRHRVRPPVGGDGRRSRR